MTSSVAQEELKAALPTLPPMDRPLMDDQAIERAQFEEKCQELAKQAMAPFSKRNESYYQKIGEESRELYKLRDSLLKVQSGKYHKRTIDLVIEIFIRERGSIPTSGMSSLRDRVETLFWFHESRFAKLEANKKLLANCQILIISFLLTEKSFDKKHAYKKSTKIFWANLLALAS